MTENESERNPYQPPADQPPTDQPNASGPISITTFLYQNLRDLFSTRRSLLRRMYEESLRQQVPDDPMPSTFEEARNLYRARLRATNPDVDFKTVDDDERKIARLKRIYAGYAALWILFLPSAMTIVMMWLAIRTNGLNWGTLPMALGLATLAMFGLGLAGVLIFGVTARAALRLIGKAVGLAIQDEPIVQGNESRPTDHPPESAP